MASEDVLMVLKAETSQFISKMDEANGKVTKLSAQGSSGFSKFETIATASLFAVGAAAVAAGAFGLKMADDYEAAHARLETAIHNTGGNFDQLSGKVKATDSQMENLGFANADTESSLATLTGATHNSQQAMGLMGLAANIARGRHIDLATATGILVKVETGHVALLGRLGINTKDATGATISQEEAVKRLTALYGGQAQAYTQTFAGKMAVLQAKGEDLGKTIGLDVIPVIEGLATAGLDAVKGLEAANAATGGFLGEIALIGGGTLLAVGAISKLSDGVSFLATKLGLHAAEADADAAATTTQTIAYNELLIAQAASVTANAEVIAGAEAHAAAVFAEIDAQAALAADQELVATGAISLADAQAVLAADLVAVQAAATGAAAAEDLLTVAEENATAGAEALASAKAAEGLQAVGLGAEGAAVGIGSMLGPITLAAGASVALGLGFEKLFNLLPDDTAKVEGFSKALLGTAADAEQAQTALGKITGLQVAGDLANYSTQLLSNADAKTLNATKTQALVDAEHQAAISIFGASDAAKLSTADIDRLAQSNELLNRRIQDGAAGVDAATKTMDGLVAKYGQAAINTQELTNAQKTYSDLLAGGTAGVNELAKAHDAVVKAAGKVATTQALVNDATQQGTTDTTAATAAAKERTKSLDALGKVIGSTAAKTVDAASVSTPAIDALTTSLKDMDKAFESSFTKADSVLDTFKDKSKVSYQEFINAQFKSIVATANWSNNIATLSKDGIDQGFLQTLIDAGPSSAGVVQTLLDHVSQGSIGTVNKMEEAARAAQTKTEAELNAVKVKAAETSLFVNTLQTKFNITADASQAYATIQDLLTKLGVAADSARGLAIIAASIQQGGGGRTRKRAVGGPVTEGEPYLIGEKGPELFVPKTSGTIIPNNKLGSSGGRPLGTSSGRAGDTYNITVNTLDAHTAGDVVIRAIQDYNRTKGPANIKVTAG